MAGRFAKTAAPYLSEGKYLNGNNSTGEAVTGGQLTTVPNAIGASQGFANIPGDRFIFTPADAVALSNNNVGILYTGTYRYVNSAANSTSGPKRGCAAFWDPTGNGLTGNNISSNAVDALYMVTSDGNQANYSNTLFAGVFVNPFTKGNQWFIQEAGKASCKFLAAITGTPAIGGGVYLATTPAANNNTTDNGAFDQLTGANIGAGPIAAANFYATVDNLLNKYVGVAETLPSNNNVSLVNIQGGRAFWRW